MRPIYIFDLDGTLTNADHRVHYLTQTPRDWTGWYAACGEDKPNLPVISVLNGLNEMGAEVKIWTGRSSEVRSKTLDWLWDNHIAYDEILMRERGDHTEDHVLKARWLSALSDDERGRIMAVFEDRERMVQMYRDRGLTCLQVADGKF